MIPSQINTNLQNLNRSKGNYKNKRLSSQSVRQNIQTRIEQSNKNNKFLQNKSLNKI